LMTVRGLPPTLMITFLRSTILTVSCLGARWYTDHRYWSTQTSRVRHSSRVWARPFGKSLRLSETNANAAKERLSAELDELARTRPELAASIKQEVAQFETDAMRAVDEYTNDQRVVGNTLPGRRPAT
jgi:hypothetical protein